MISGAHVILYSKDAEADRALSPSTPDTAGSSLLSRRRKLQSIRPKKATPASSI
jgi:hypothetical protein